MAIPVFNQQQIDRIRRMILDYEAGNLTNLPGNGSTRTGQIQLNVFKIESPADGGGKYNLTLLQPNNGGTDDDVDDTTDLTIDDLGKEYDAPDSMSYLGIYPPEVGTSDHNLQTGKAYVAMTRRQQTGDDSTGTKLVAVIIGGGGTTQQGQYMGQVNMETSQNQSGFIFPFAHAMS